MRWTVWALFILLAFGGGAAAWAGAAYTTTECDFDFQSGDFIGRHTTHLFATQLTEVSRLRGNAPKSMSTICRVQSMRRAITSRYQGLEREFEIYCRRLSRADSAAIAARNGGRSI